LRLVDAELDAVTKLDATKVASAELIGGAKLIGNMWLAGGSTCRAQGQRVDVGGAEVAGNTGLSGGSARVGFRRCADSGWGMVVTRAGWLAARVRDKEEMRRLHDILPLHIALNEEWRRQTKWNRRG
jgi:hypothetical protein